MSRHVHFVGTIGLDSVEEVFATAGKVLGPHLVRCPDGETGGRRQWVMWQYPFLRSSPYLQADVTKFTTDAAALSSANPNDAQKISDCAKALTDSLAGG